MQFLTQCLQPLYPEGLHRILHLILSRGGRSSGAAGVGEYVDESRTHDVAEEGICFLEKFICLARESHDHVDAEEYFRPTRYLGTFSDILDLMCECSCVITPSHLLENGVASALKRNVETGRKRLVKVNPTLHIDGTAALLDALTVRQKWYVEIGEQLKNRR